MKTAISIGSAYESGENWDELVDFTVQADRLGVDQVWSAEAWGMDAVVPLAYVAAKTESIKIGTGIMQITARVPPMTAMTAMSLNRVSKGRFLLGLGVSGPQVVEGLHGASFAKPLSRLKETITVIKQGLEGEKINFSGDHVQFPRVGGEGKPIRLSQPPVPDLPIYLATLGPKSLEYTGEVANGWLGTSFIPEHHHVFTDHIRRGAEGAGRSLEDIDLAVGSSIEIGDDVERMIEARRPALAFTLGGMGSAKTNFYNSAYSRAGYGDVCAEVQRLWVDGDKAGAAAAVPEELVLSAYMIGTDDMVRDRIRATAAAGVNCLRIGMQGKTPADQLANLEQTVDLIRSATAG